MTNLKNFWLTGMANGSTLWGSGAVGVNQVILHLSIVIFVWLICYSCLKHHEMRSRKMKNEKLKMIWFTPADPQPLRIEGM
jgi:hypothetical protein